MSHLTPMPRPVRFTADETQQIIHAYAAGDSPVTIGKRVGCSSATIVRVLDSEGIKRRGRAESQRGKSPPNRRVFSPAELDRMAELAGEGLALAAIGREFGVSGPTVRKRLQKLGLSTARRSALTPGQRADLVERYRAGESVKALAAVFGVSPPPITKALTDAGVRLRSLSEAMKGKTAHNKRTFTEAERGEIERLWMEERLTLAQISSRLGVGSTTPVHRLIQELGLQREKVGVRRRRLAEEKRQAFRRDLRRGGFDRLKEQHRRGYSFAELAEQEGVSLRLVRTELSGRGLGNDGAKLSLDTRQALLRDYGKRRGSRLADLATEHGVRSPTVVLNFLSSRGVDTALAFQFSDEDLLRMKELYLAGMGTHEIADVFSQERDEAIHHYTVSQKLREQRVQLSGYTARHPHESPSAGSIQLDGGWEKDVAVHLDRLV